MEGVIDHHMRYILSEVGGIDLCVTEFIRINDHTLPRRIFLKYCPELATGEDKLEHTTRLPTRVQLLGSDPKAIALNARKAARLGAPAVDLNFGCPAKTVNRNRGGACLLDETDLIYEIVSRTRELVPTETPVTVKIRLGYNERDSYLKNAEAIDKAGANELVVHARSKNDGYNPPAYWSTIKEITQHVDIPVIANGEIWNVSDYLKCKGQSGCDNLMLGRGILAKPDLAVAIKHHNAGQPYSEKTWSEIAKLVLDFFELTCHHYHKKHMGNRVKQWLFYLQRNYTGAQATFEKIKRSKDYEFIHSTLLNEIQI